MPFLLWRVLDLDLERAGRLLKRIGTMPRGTVSLNRFIDDFRLAILQGELEQTACPIDAGRLTDESNAPHDAEPGIGHGHFVAPRPGFKRQPRTIENEYDLG